MNKKEFDKRVQEFDDQLSKIDSHRFKSDTRSKQLATLWRQQKSDLANLQHKQSKAIIEETDAAEVEAAILKLRVKLEGTAEARRLLQQWIESAEIEQRSVKQERQNFRNMFLHFTNG